MGLFQDPKGATATDDPRRPKEELAKRRIYARRSPSVGPEGSRTSSPLAFTQADLPSGSLSSISSFSIRFAMSRSAARREVLHSLARGGPAYFRQIMRTTGLDANAVQGALRGKSPRYATAHSLVALGLVTETRVGVLVVFQVTSAGLRVAAELGIQV